MSISKKVFRTVFSLVAVAALAGCQTTMLTGPSKSEKMDPLFEEVQMRGSLENKDGTPKYPLAHSLLGKCGVEDGDILNTQYIKELKHKSVEAYQFCWFGEEGLKNYPRRLEADGLVKGNPVLQGKIFDFDNVEKKEEAFEWGIADELGAQYQKAEDKAIELKDDVVAKFNKEETQEPAPVESVN